MSDTLDQIKNLIRKEKVLISSHGYEELADDKIFVRDLIDTIKDSFLVEDYPDFGKGPCVLVLQKDRDKKPVHAVWGIPKGSNSPAVLVTAYRPDPNRWSKDYLERQP